MDKTKAMVENKKQQSMEKVARAIETIERFFAQDRELSIKDLASESGLSVSFFYHNECVRKLLEDRLQLQCSSELFKLRKQVALLQSQLKESVPRSQYDELAKELEKAKTEILFTIYQDLTI